MDLALGLVEEDLGSSIALEVARELVLYLRRPGGQSQFSTALSLQSAEGERFRNLGVWILEHLDGDLSVYTLARRMAMSPRNFARLFANEFRTTPAKYIESVRIEAARRILEQNTSGLEEIASTCGFHSADALRAAFQRVLHVSPRAYRERFREARR
jgi:transcriptional regulator GlxA family with amidase domain